MIPGREHAARAAVAVAGVAGITVVYGRWLHGDDATTAVLLYLLLILFVAASSPRWVSVTTSIVAAFSLDFFFLPPVRTLNIEDPNDWVALIAFLCVSIVASHLSSLARAREFSLQRLFDFSREALLDPGGDAFRTLAGQVATHFGLEHVAIYLPRGLEFERYEAGQPRPDLLPDKDVLQRIVEGTVTGANALLAVRPDIFVFMPDTPRSVWLLPLERGTSVVGVLAIAGRVLEPATLNALASAVAIAIERLRLLEHREQAQVERRSVEIKSALLSSLAHDLRTPLTAATIAVGNLRVPSLPADQRDRQAEIALAGLDQLSRLFQNIIEMAELDAGVTAPSARWVHPSEVIQAARARAAYALRAHPVSIVDQSDDQVAYVDARLLATALGHVLENAAQYSPPGSTITITHALAAKGLSFVVDDQGPGFGVDDLPHLFERFYRGRHADRQTSGTGMGLAIVRGLMLALGGNVIAENREASGARVVLFAPALIRIAADADPPTGNS